MGFDHFGDVADPEQPLPEVFGHVNAEDQEQILGRDGRNGGAAKGNQL